MAPSNRSIRQTASILSPSLERSSKMIIRGLRALIATALVAGCAATPSIDESRLLDLTWPFNEDTLYWPTNEHFELVRVAYGRDQDGKWYASNDFSASEHGGTHLDAPIHFAEGRRSTSEIGLEQLVAPARVIDAREACAADRD
jgi:hypothetical protein